MPKAIESSPVHGTAVAVGGRGLLILGPSGSGKSGLALQMIALGAALIADDQVLLHDVDSQVTMSAPETIANLIEARGIGILPMPAQSGIALHQVVDLGRQSPRRLPDPQVITVLGIRTPLIAGGDVPNLAPALMLMLRNG